MGKQEGDGEDRMEKSWQLRRETPRQPGVFRLCIYLPFPSLISLQPLGKGTGCSSFFFTRAGRSAHAKRVHSRLMQRVTFSPTRADLGEIPILTPTQCTVSAWSRFLGIKPCDSNCRYMRPPPTRVPADATRIDCRDVRLGRCRVRR